MAGADTRLAAVAHSANEELAVAAIRALASRKATGQAELLFQLARDENPNKRQGAIEALGVVVDAKNVEQLVQLMVDGGPGDDLPAIEQSLSRVLSRLQSPAETAQPILTALASAAAAAQPLLIRQLAKASTPNALDAVRRALKSPDSPLSDAAVLALANWRDDTASDDLIKLIEAARTEELKKTALDGYIRIASRSDDPSAKFLDALKQVSQIESKQKIVKEIGLKCESLEAAEATQSLLTDSKLGSTAAIATIRIAYKLRLSHKEQARKILESVLATMEQPEIQKRAQDVLNDLDKYTDHILQWVAIGPFGGKQLESGEQCYNQMFEPEQADTSNLNWKPLELGIGSWEINLEATYDKIDHCAAYLATMIWSPVDEDVQVEGGTDDALKIWVNGELVFNEYRGLGGSTAR